MVTGVGADILLIERIRDQITSDAFMRRVFTPEEMNVGRWRPDPATYYAKVFAAKEAVFKCFGIAADQMGHWRNIEIKDSEEAQPEVVLSGLMAELARAKKVKKVMLSVSSDMEYALAFAAVEREVPQ
jgi:phosphopantetheine--protein transferase-like protein